MFARARLRWRPRTLSKQLMLGVSALVTTIVVAVGGLSIYTMHDYVEAVSDVEVTHSLAAFEHSLTDPSEAGRARLAAFTGQSPGTVIAVLRNGTVTRSAIFDDSGATAAPAEAESALQSVTWGDDASRTIDLGGLGPYRVASTVLDNGDRLLSAVSMRDATQAVAKKTVAVMLITVAAALLAAVGTVVLVRATLRPLRRVAATAARAATMPLSDDAPRITTRVREADSMPDSEVGIVGETLNRLLANVDSALAARVESDRRMRRFLTDASHELRTPLAAIRGYAELTRQDGPALPESTEYALARIESESRRMSVLVDDMMLLSRLDERRGLELDELDVCELVADAVNDVAVTAPRHRFTADLPDDPVWLRGDGARLHQVVGNLLTNASVHNPAGATVATTVRIPSAGTVELVISDDGQGIDAAVLPELFERFVRADKARSREHNGSGLGLAIVASIVAAHGGSVDVRSSPGETTFTVRLPSAV